MQQVSHIAYLLNFVNQPPIYEYPRAAIFGRFKNNYETFTSFLFADFVYIIYY